MLHKRNLIVALTALLAGGTPWGGFDGACQAPLGDGYLQAGSAAFFDIPTVLKSPSMAPATTPPSIFGVEAFVAGWRGNTSDNICGIEDLRKVSNPGQVDYPDLLAATPQMKRIKKDGIDPDSAQGRILRQEAARLITKSCQIIRSRGGFCGIWKEIAHSDKRSVPDVTSDVRAELN
ncbi:MAG: hypothetical protein ACI8QS_000762 [Planctomycetota bacterium]|jgi:hypothetical protein